MRVPCTILAFCLSVIAAAQPVTGEWICPGEGYLLLSDSNAFLENKLWFTYFDETSYTDKFITLRHVYEKKKKRAASFRIIGITDRNLTIIPARSSKYYFLGADTIHFTRRNYLYDSTIQFKRLTYIQTDEPGSVLSFSVEIDSTGAVLCEYNEENEKRMPKGIYSGTLGPEKLSALQEILRNCNLKDLFYSPVVRPERSVVSLYVYYNDDVKMLRSMFPSRLTDDLLTFIYSLHEFVELEKVADVTSAKTLFH